MPVYTKKDGRIFCVYYDGPRRIWEPFGRGEEARKTAETRDLEIKLKKKKGQWYIKHRLSSLGCADLVQAYIDSRSIELSTRTIDGILIALTKYILPFIKKKPAFAVGIEDWNQIQDSMIRSGLNARTINKYFNYMSNIFSWGIENNFLEHHPWDKRKRLRVRKKAKIDLFTLKEFKRILRKAKPHCAWALEVAYYTGVRPGPDELFSLRWSDINWKTKGIHIYCHKTDTWRWQFPDPEFMKKLRQRQRKAKKDYPDCPWIISYQGKQVKSIKRTWKDAKEKAHITRRIRLYDIRHFYITYALASGADIMDLAERVGHVNGEMIMRVYAHLAKDLKRQKALQIPSLYSKQKKS